MNSDLCIRRQFFPPSPIHHLMFLQIYLVTPKKGPDPLVENHWTELTKYV